VTTRKRTTGRPPRTTPAQSTTPQRDEATGAAAAGARTRYRDMKLPNERDESAEGDTSLSHGDAGRPVIEQGATDIESGQRDTDCYTANDPRYRKQEGKR
jgi:hypothetical protein